MDETSWTHHHRLSGPSENSIEVQDERVSMLEALFNSCCCKMNDDSVSPESLIGRLKTLVKPGKTSEEIDSALEDLAKMLLLSTSSTSVSSSSSGGGETPRSAVTRSQFLEVGLLWISSLDKGRSRGSQVEALQEKSEAAQQTTASFWNHANRKLPKLLDLGEDLADVSFGTLEATGGDLAGTEAGSSESLLGGGRDLDDLKLASRRMRDEMRVVKLQLNSAESEVVQLQHDNEKLSLQLQEALVLASTSASSTVLMGDDGAAEDLASSEDDGGGDAASTDASSSSTTVTLVVPVAAATMSSKLARSLGGDPDLEEWRTWGQFASERAEALELEKARLEKVLSDKCRIIDRLQRDAHVRSEYFAEVQCANQRLQGEVEELKEAVASLVEEGLRRRRRCSCSNVVGCEGAVLADDDDDVSFNLDDDDDRLGTTFPPPICQQLSNIGPDVPDIFEEKPLEGVAAVIKTPEVSDRPPSSAGSDSDASDNLERLQPQSAAIWPPLLEEAQRRLDKAKRALLTSAPQEAGPRSSPGIRSTISNEVAQRHLERVELILDQLKEVAFSSSKSDGSARISASTSKDEPDSTTTTPSGKAHAGLAARLGRVFRKVFRFVLFVTVGLTLFTFFGAWEMNGTKFYPITWSPSWGAVLEPIAFVRVEKVPAVGQLMAGGRYRDSMTMIH